MSAEITTPGVYVGEVPSGVRTITGVSTSVAAFVGAASRGRSCRAVRITSIVEFEQRFGGLVPNLELGYAVQQFFLNGGTEAWIVRVARTLTDATVIKGLHALDAVDLFNLLVIPGETKLTMLSAAADYCRQRRGFLIADAPKTAMTPAQMEQAMQSGAVPKTSWGAIYFPWINISDPLNGGQLRVAPPSGTIAGLFARMDGTRGVWKAPAGTEAVLASVTGLQYSLTDAENGVLNPLGINCLRVFPVYGCVVWGALTLRGADQVADEYKYVPVRRLALFIEESIFRGIQWTVFEPNDEPLWAQLRFNVGAFMHDLFRQGAFQAQTPRDAYFVKCDKDTTTQDDINKGIVNIVVGFAPLKPAEFIILKIQAMAVSPS